jgi:hypothetical protein
MPIFNFENGYLFAYFNNKTRDQIDFLLSKELKKEYEQKRWGEKCTEGALLFAFEWCSNKLLDILNLQTDLRFYQAIYLLHEVSCFYSEHYPEKSPVEEISSIDYAIYRRVLKICLEHACDIPIEYNKSFLLII